MSDTNDIFLSLSFLLDLKKEEKKSDFSMKRPLALSELP